ncbi:hypothetical protein DL95DRAFT_435079 [Leptodontidium sp. 2 PMI_412]|nr:hypothetical protein DL95DRAFT_435079 [Leptodontidium sp. 2 PMI_412]
MNVNKRHELIHGVQTKLWVDKVNDARVDGCLLDWVSTFHPDGLSCHLEGAFIHGGYNVCQKMAFSDGTYADEKVAMEVEVLSLIRENTTIPVPDIKAWGLAVDNPLGLGPFIIMNFIEGVSLNHLLRKNNDTRLIKPDISDGDIEFLYKQFAHILLQLFKLDFDRIGSLPSPKTGFPVPIRPLTFKVHDILQPEDKEFSTTTEYFQYLFDQDWKQLLSQPNSIGGKYTGRAKYASFKVLKSLIPDLVERGYDRGLFKLICDDLGLANLIVRSEEDLTIVGVVDWEWSYVGPAQLFGSAPWWLLQDRLNNWDTDLDEEELPDILARYQRYLEIFKRVLKEEEEKISGGETALSDLVRRSEDSGAMWLYMMLSWGFNHPHSLPFSQLRHHIGDEKWDQLELPFFETEDIDKFTEQKMAQMEQYEQDLERTKADMADVDNQKMTAEEFVATL